MTNLSLSQMEQVTDGKVARKFWEQIVFVVWCRSTDCRKYYYNDEMHIDKTFVLKQKGEILFYTK